MVVVTTQLAKASVVGLDIGSKNRDLYATKRPTTNWLCSAAIALGCSEAGNSEPVGFSVQPIQTSSEAAEIEQWLKLANVPEEDVLARVRTERDEYDCVRWRDQPALKGVRGARIVAPPHLPPEEPPGGIELDGATRVPAQTEYGDSAVKCPSGAVPVRRFTLDGLSHVRTLGELKEELARRQDSGGHLPAAPNCPAPSPSASKFYEVYSSELPSAKNAASAQIIVEDPTVASGGMSLGQMWLTRRTPCSGYTSADETIESGWVKFGAASGPQFFVFYTGDGYDADSCWNSTINPGGNFFCNSVAKPFVTYPGSVFVPGGFFSSLGYIRMEWLQGTGGEWWLRINNHWAGYYGNANFDSGLQSGFTWMAVGGEIDNDNGTQMGNGTWGNLSGASPVSKFWWSEGPGSAYQFPPNSYYIGEGRIGGFWNTSGAYASTISTNRDSFAFGGPGPGWN